MRFINKANGREYIGVPSKCDVCNQPIGNAFVDGRTRMGAWANMCPDCHQTVGVGIGVGKGQRYDATPTPAVRQMQCDRSTLPNDFIDNDPDGQG